MTHILTRRRAIYFAIETTPGTSPAAPATPTAIVAEDVTLEASSSSREFTRPDSLTPLPSSFGPTPGTLRFAVPITGMDAAVWHGLLPACGWVQTGGTGPYRPSSLPPGSGAGEIKTCTLWFRRRHRLAQLSGACGRFRFGGEAGELPMATFEFEGIFTPSVSAPPATVNVDAGQGLRSVAACLDYDGMAPQVYAWEFDSGNQVQVRPDCCGADGLAHATIVQRRPSFRATFESDLVTDWDLKRRSGAVGGLEFSLAAGGHGLAIACDSCQVVEASYGDRDGTMVEEVRILATSETADGEAELVFT